MKTQYALMLSLLVSAFALAGCALVTPTPPAAGDAAGAARPDSVAALEGCLRPAQPGRLRQRRLL